MELPLLRKELWEQSARARTYVIRGVYAVLFYLSVQMITAEVFLSSQSSLVPTLSVLGRGGEIYKAVTVLQFVGIYALLPALACGAFTVEKERQTLPLLLLTRIPVWQLVFEKYLSRIIPMLTCLMLSLPILGFIYSLGGIASEEIWIGVWYLILATLQVAATAVCCSVYCRTTAAAFLLTYVVLGTFWAIPNLWRLFAPQAFESFIFVVDHLPIAGFSRIGQLADTYCSLLYPPGLWHSITTRSELSLAQAAWGGVPILLSVAMMMFIAVRGVWACAFTTYRNRMLSVFQRLDALFQSWNHWVGNIVLLPPSETTPDQEPITWRESSKRAYGQPRYLIRLFLLLEVPVLILLTTASQLGGGSRESVQGLTLLVWLITGLILCGNSAALIATERSRQTLEVLFSTPMSSREIIRQKVYGSWKLMIVCAIPLLTCILYYSWWLLHAPTNVYWRSDSLWNQYPLPIWVHSVSYLIAGVGSIAVYFPLICWVSVWRGAPQASAGRAMIAAMGYLVAYCLAPLLLLGLPLTSLAIAFGGDSIQVMSLAQLSPLSILVFSELAFRDRAVLAIIPITLTNSLLYLAWLRWVKNQCLTDADRLLGRTPNY